MADITINGLTAYTTPQAGDFIGVWDIALGQYKKTTRSQLVGVNITGGGTLDLGGFTLTVPASGTAALLGVANAGTFILARTDLTIASGAVTATRSYHRLDTEGAAATDDLDTINGGTTGHILVIQSNSAARVVVVKHGTGNIFLNGMADFSLTGGRDKLALISLGTEWNEIGRGNNQ